MERRSKYNAQRVTVDGIQLDSLKEARRYADLKLLERAGVIRALKIHPMFEIVVNGVHICRYEADFQYYENDQQITEDSKGVRTPTYKLKRRLMKAVHGVDIRET